MCMTVIYCTIVVDSQRDQTTAPVVEIIGRHHNTVAGPNNAQPLERTLTSIAAFMRLFFCCVAATQFVKRWSRNCADAVANQCQSPDGCKSSNYRHRCVMARGGSMSAVGNARQDNCEKPAAKFRQIRLQSSSRINRKKWFIWYCSREMRTVRFATVHYSTEREFICHKTHVNYSNLRLCQ